MSRIFLILAILFVVVGLMAAVFAPLDGMSETEAFFARLILIGPATLIGLLVAALAVMIGRFDRLIALHDTQTQQARIKPQSASTELVIETEDEAWLPFEDSAAADTSSTDTLSVDEKIEARLNSSLMPEFSDSSDTPNEPAVAAPPVLETLVPETKIDERRAPTVDEYLGQERRKDDSENTSALSREGTFAGRAYRMYEDGSLEIDTDQSTIRFDSLDEFRNFVSNVSKD